MLKKQIASVNKNKKGSNFMKKLIVTMSLGGMMATSSFLMPTFADISQTIPTVSEFDKSIYKSFYDMSEYWFKYFNKVNLFKLDGDNFLKLEWNDVNHGNPFLSKEGKAMLPISLIAEQLGYEYDFKIEKDDRFEDPVKRIVLKSNLGNIFMTEFDTTVKFDYPVFLGHDLKEMVLKSSPINIKGKTYLSADDLFSMLGYKGEYKTGKNGISIQISPMTIDEKENLYKLLEFERIERERPDKNSIIEVGLPDESESSAAPKPPADNNKNHKEKSTKDKNEDPRDKNLKKVKTK